MKIYTKSGDEGETGLLFGGRVSKAHIRTEAYGSTDHAVSAIGLARALSDDDKKSLRTLIDSVAAFKPEPAVTGTDEDVPF